MLQLSVLGVGADAGEADEGALACRRSSTVKAGVVTAMRAMPRVSQNRLTTPCVSRKFLDEFWNTEAARKTASVTVS